MTNEPEWDARTLADAEVIKADASRLAAAKIAAAKLAEKKREDAKAMQKVAKKKEVKSKKTNGTVRMSGQATLLGHNYGAQNEI